MTEKEIFLERRGVS